MPPKYVTDNRNAFGDMLKTNREAFAPDRYNAFVNRAFEGVLPGGPLEGVDPVTGPGIAIRDSLHHGAGFAEALRAGNYGQAAVSGLLSPAMLMGALPGVPAMGGMVRAHHGSGNLFEKFDSSKIGHGEGAQAYGRGLYFADDPAVSRSYQRALARPEDVRWGDDTTRQVAQDVHDKLAGYENVPKDFDPNTERYGIDKFLEDPAYLSEVERAAANYTSMLDRAAKDWSDAPNPHINARLKSWLDSARRWHDTSPSPSSKAAVDVLQELERRPRPRVRPEQSAHYTADIDVDPDDLLDWDKPLSEQPKKVREKLKKIDITDKKYEVSGEGVKSQEFGQEGAIDYEITRGGADQDKKIGALSVFPDGTATFDSSREEFWLLRETTYDSRDEAIVALRELENKSITGAGIVNNLAHGDTAILREAGIPGIRYLDGMSRRSGKGTYNYVVFDDKLIDIVKRDPPLPTK